MKAPYGFYENGFDYIRLEDLRLEGLPKTLDVDGNEMVRKPEFHISLVWVGRLAAMVDEQNADEVEAEMIREFEDFTLHSPLEEYELNGELRKVEKGNQKTIIAMARVANLGAFFERLNQKYGTDLPVQPAHITLYTLPEDQVGIGILSEEELQEWSEPVDIPQLGSLSN